MLKFNVEVELSVADILTIVKEVATAEKESAQFHREVNRDKDVKEGMEKLRSDVPGMIESRVEKSISSAFMSSLPKILEVIAKNNGKSE